jgi:glycosyltransferase involved in cell wall biosynthesis
MTPSTHQLWAGWARDASGFADELRGFLRAGEAAGARPSLSSFRTLVPTELTEHDERTLWMQERRRGEGNVVAIHSYVPWRSQPTILGVPNVVRAMFETDRLCEARLPLLLDRDEIWVPGAFNLETFERGGIPREKLHVVGGTLDFDLFDPANVTPAALPVPADHFTFLTNFAFSERKAWKQLLRGWARAFGADDGVCLVLKVHSEGRGEKIRQRIDAFLQDELGSDYASKVAPITVMDTVIASTDMPSLYAAADAYVLPTRGEGWGRPYMEAMAMGLPTIGSRWSGNTEFMHDGNSWLVDGELAPVEHGQEVFLDPCVGHQWFSPAIESIAQQLRAVAGDREGARAKAAGARGELIERFGPDVIAARVAELSAAAWERHHERRANPVALALRGPAGSVSSLAVVNDALAEGFKARGLNIHRCGPEAEFTEGLACPTITHHWPPRFEGSDHGPRIAILPWEYGAAPAEWVDAANAVLDRVWVPSEYVRQGYIASGMPAGAVEVVPNGVDVEHFTPAGDRRRETPDATCTFLFVGGTIWRKGIDLLLAAWTEAFGAGDDVALVIKDFGTQTHYRGQSLLGDLRRLAADPGVAPIAHLTDEVPYGELPALYRGADVLVAPYRAEGFCLPALEAMACGLPVIHNGEGPTGEFVPGDAGWALPARRVPLRPNGGIELSGEGWVNEVDHDALVAALRAAAADAAERRQRGARGAQAAQALSWDHAVDAALGSLQTLQDEALGPVRDVTTATIESQGHTVLFAPDWSGDDWQGTLEAWLAAFGHADPVTLALFTGDADVEALSARIMAVIGGCGLPEDELPDIALLLPTDHSLESLVLGADAVLVDGAAGEPPSFVRRRARRLLAADPAALRAFAGALPVSAPEAEPAVATPVAA